MTASSKEPSKKGGLTPKQEKFCMVYLETGNASEAYRQAYDASKMSAPVIHVKANEVLANGKVAVRLEELRKPIIERHNITVDDLIAELDENRKAALSAETVQASAATAATMAKAKLLGYLSEKIELTGKDGGPIETNIGLDASKLSTAALKEIIEASGGAVNHSPPPPAEPPPPRIIKNG